MSDQQYSIYVLIDPLDKQVRYVGRSLNPYARFGQHMQCRETNPEKNAWIQGLLQQNQAPTLQILEVVIGSKQAHKREAYWIQHYLEHQAPLTNIIVNELIEVLQQERLEKNIQRIRQIEQDFDSLHAQIKEMTAEVDKMIAERNEITVAIEVLKKVWEEQYHD